MKRIELQSKKQHQNSIHEEVESRIFWKKKLRELLESTTKQRQVKPVKP